MKKFISENKERIKTCYFHNVRLVTKSIMTYLKCFFKTRLKKEHNQLKKITLFYFRNKISNKYKVTFCVIQTKSEHFLARSLMTK